MAQKPGRALALLVESENVKNDTLLELIQKIRRSGIKCYIATEQEKYRAEYIRDRMFPGDFDGVFSTGVMGYRKNDPRFYEAMCGTLAVLPEDIIFFDDSESKIKTARSLGINAILYQGVKQVEDILMQGMILPETHPLSPAN